jgi:hypothetical protein
MELSLENKMTNKKAAMEMSIGTLVTIVLLMTVLILGLILVQRIFVGATDSVDSINDQVMTQINNLFSTENRDLVVSLGSQHTAKVKQGTTNFGLVVGYAPENTGNLNTCEYDITTATGSNYCKEKLGAKPLEWFVTGYNNVKFSETQNGVGFDLIKLNVPGSLSPCLQRFTIQVGCGTGTSKTTASTYFDIEVIKKGFL